ncbi:MAG TPA: 23S rRNA (adenine(2503)-C(2))-methyltransferase RlmN [Planctomycetota bacterium]|nr:23S rRNA (adenine(2503)-C(2))-methyltransferase RlmN [Planctomycetota bacterium]
MERRQGAAGAGSLAGLAVRDLEALVDPPYRAKQIFRWVQARGAVSYDAMTDVPKAVREALAARLPVRSSRVAESHRSDDGTVKLLLCLADGEKVECVLIPEGDRRTACISTQVGCGVGCVFCASGAQGVIRNLEAFEIVEQVLWLRDAGGASGDQGARLTNIVVMGMGEPLHNVESLVRALRLVQDPEGIDLGSRRITISTSGPRKGFEELLASGLRTNLAISLHAATDDLRRRLVPRGGTADVAGLSGMAREWFEATGRDVTFEYVLLSGINDRDEDAEALARLAGRHRNVNLIPMNPVSFAPELKAPSPERVERFAGILRKAGVVVHARRQRGDDVAAACGQLRLSRP